jgi:hypothetical protein
MNIESANFKLDFINSCTHNIRICFQQQLKTINVVDFGEVNKHVWSEDLRGLEDHIL